MHSSLLSLWFSLILLGHWPSSIKGSSLSLSIVTLKLHCSAYVHCEAFYNPASPNLHDSTSSILYSASIAMPYAYFSLRTLLHWALWVLLYFHRRRILLQPLSIQPPPSCSLPPKWLGLPFSLFFRYEPPSYPLPKHFFVFCFYFATNVKVLVIYTMAFFS